MYYLYLMALGGIKSLVLFNTMLSFLTLLILLRLASKIYKSNTYINLISLIYLTTPLIFVSSTILYVDIIPVFFVFSALIFFKYSDSKIVVKYLLIISLMLGFSFFAKQTTFPFIISFILVILYFLLKSFVLKETKLSSLLFIVFASVIFFLLPFFPLMLIIWYKTGNPVFPFMNAIFKSKYFSMVNMQDFFVAVNHILGFNINSIFTIVFNTQKNIEMPNGALGYYLLLICLFPLIFIFKKSRENKWLLLMTYCVITVYFLSTYTSYNIRYFLPVLILAIILSSYVIVFLLRFIRNKLTQRILLAIILIALCFPNIIYIIKYSYINQSMFIPNNNLALNANESVLTDINDHDVKLLSNNDCFRGSFKGQFYSLLWYNAYFLEKLNKKEITPIDLLCSFDYYLYDKLFSETLYLPPGTFSYTNPDIKNYLILEKESPSHLLFRIDKNKLIKTNIIFEEKYDVPRKVSVNNSMTITLNNNFSGYIIEIAAGKSGDGRFMSGWQINWSDVDGSFISNSLIPFKYDGMKNSYVSPTILEIPQKAKQGILYPTSNDNKLVLIYSYKLIGIKKIENIVEKELEEYNKKWPYLSRKAGS